ncbi:hypothetical protein GCM10007893_03160 [Paracoccus marinus]|nr:hypothetical protein GCM10007893_03160 [Paracoccus marinus]
MEASIFGRSSEPSVLTSGWSRRTQDFRKETYEMNIRREDSKRAALEKQIDENLRRVYEQDQSQEVPDRFLSLLEKLRGQE